MTRKGYIYKGISGWTVAWWTGPSAEETEYTFGIPTWAEALEVLKGFWNRR